MKNLFTSETAYLFVRQTGIALGHSLWIGAVTALLAAAVMLSTRRSRPEIRYNLLTGLLVMFIAATAAAFVLSGAGLPASERVTGISMKEMSDEGTVLIQTAMARQSFVRVAADFFAQHIHIITLTWLVVVLAKTTGLLLGLYRLYQLKTRRIYSMGSHWEQRVGEFAKAMGIVQHVRIFQSGLVKVPTVLGHFKPVILVPLGVITSIPPEQIEMVLLHELAHIRRLDFFVNFLQRLTELLFFFNPGILWISKLIREEREHCCDDMALQYSGNQAVYIRALLSFREYQLNDNVYQLAFIGKGGLVQRAKRIASRTNSTLGAVEKTILLVAMLAFLTFSVLFAQTGSRQSGGRHPGGRQSENGRINAQAPTQKGNAKQAPRTGNVGAANNGTQALSGINRPNGVNSQNTINQSIKNSNEAPKRIVERQGSLSPRLVSPDSLQPLQNALAPISQPLAPIYTDTVGEGRLVPVVRQPYAARYQTQPLRMYKQDYQPNPIRIKRQTINEKIMDAIEQQGVPISRDNIDFRITNKELIVNGVKQPEAVLKGVLDAVLTRSHDVIDFTYGSHR